MGLFTPEPNANLPLLRNVHTRYFENGVADELKLDFGEFVVDGRLGELQPIPSTC